MPILITPCASLHGSGPELLDDILTVRSKVRELARYITEHVDPNGRDYYLSGPDAIKTAIREHALVVDAISAVADDLLHLVEGSTDGSTCEFVLNEKVAQLKNIPTVHPMIHINGSGKEALVNASRTAYVKANEVFEAINTLNPNMRDYADRDLWIKARDQQALRLLVLKGVGQFYLLRLLELKKAL